MCSLGMSSTLFLSPGKKKKSRSLLKCHLDLWCTKVKAGTHFKDRYSWKVKEGDTVDGNALLVIDIGKGACFTRHLLYASFKIQSYCKKF